MTSWAFIAAALAGWTILSVLISLAVGKVIAFCTRADSHLEQTPTRVELGEGTPGSTHPLDETRLVWLWPPAVDYHRERRQG